MGFYKARDFFPTKFDYITSNEPGHYPTIFWKPDLITDEHGNASFSFFNAGKGIYRIVIEGMDDYGNLARHVYTYKVQ